MNKNVRETVTTIRPFSPAIGENIGAEAGGKMVKSFFDAHPEQAYGHVIGRNILDQLLAQPGAAGLSIYPGYNEAGVRQLIFAAVDADGQEILQYTVIHENGRIEMRDGIVADKISTTPEPTLPSTTTTLTWFS
jgi:hypothetical protein